MEASKVIEFPILNYRVVVILTDDISASRESRKTELGPVGEPISKYVDGMHSYDDYSPDSYIFISPEGRLGTIAHECYHVVDRMFRWIGAKHENELTAYHLGYLTDEIIEFIKEKPLKLVTNVDKVSESKVLKKRG